MDKLKSREDFINLINNVSGSIDSEKKVVRICMTGCRAHGAEDLLVAFKEHVTKENLNGQIEIRETGCQGLCSGAPVLSVDPHGFFYQKVSPDDVSQIINDSILNGKPIERLGYKLDDGAYAVKQGDMPFFKRQEKIVLRNCGIIDPMNINHYLSRNGYMALDKAIFDMTPLTVIDEMKKSGLRGRGGAGFPTGFKWELAHNNESDEKYVICNADEGDPGAFMDRGVLEGDPHSIIEGLAIAAYAIGANKGFVYVRAEYPIAVNHMMNAINQARKIGFLGKNILGCGFDFDLEIKQGAGAFVCGEETALMASIEGKRGMPRLKPPFPSDSGLYGKPTIINNVETLASVAPIITNGSGWYSAYGTEGSKGTKIFSLAGKIKNTGLVEVPLGIKIDDVINEIGGGVLGEHKFKAVQMGGPSGGCMPNSMTDLEIDYDSLKTAGAIMGSGGMVIVDETTCMVDFAKFFLQFLQDESCGKCVPCRIGTKRILEILTKITKRRAKMEDFDKLIELADVVGKGSLCGLGQTAPNPLLSTIRHFKDEYIAHIEEKKCPAGVCSKRVVPKVAKEAVKT